MARRLLVSILLVVVATVLAMLWATTRTINSSFDEFRSVHLDAHLHYVPRELLSYYRNHERWEGIEPLVESIGRSLNMDVAIVDQYGNVVAATSADIQTIAELAEPNAADFVIPLRGGNPGESIGTAYFHSSALLRQRDREFLRQLVLSALYVGLGVAVVASIGGYAVARSFSKPVINLSKAAKQVAKGNYDIQVDVTRNDEIGQLSHAFNQMAAEIGKLEKVRRNLVMNVSHDLRTPLTVIGGYLEGLRLGKIVDRRSAEHVFDVMHNEVQSLGTLIDSLNEVAALDSGEIPLNRSRVGVAFLVNRAVERIQPTADMQDVRIKVLVDRDQLKRSSDLVLVDADKIGQALYNLLDNAIHYSAAGDTITIDGTINDTYATFTVEDRGDGVSVEHQPFIFERFYRADQARNRQKSGYGMGLSIVRSIVHAHGGTVHVSSTGTPGEPTRFMIQIPC